MIHMVQRNATVSTRQNSSFKSQSRSTVTERRSSIQRLVDSELHSVYQFTNLSVLIGVPSLPASHIQEGGGGGGGGGGGRPGESGSRLSTRLNGKTDAWNRDEMERIQDKGGTITFMLFTLSCSV